MKHEGRKGKTQKAREKTLSNFDRTHYQRQNHVSVLVIRNMNLLQFGNTLLDTGDVVLAERIGETTRLLLRGGHSIVLEGELGHAIWSRLSGRLIDQMQGSEQAS